MTYASAASPARFYARRFFKLNAKSQGCQEEV